MERIRGSAVAIVCIVGLSAVAQAQHGRYLLTPANSSIVGEYGGLGGGGNPVNYTAAVTDEAKSIEAGQVTFDFDTMVRQSGTSGGVAIAGGFQAANNVEVKDGYNLQWVQGIITSDPLGDAWDIPDTYTSNYYPDTGAQNDNPFYPNQSVPTGGADFNDPNDRAFQDFPSRSFVNGDGTTWFAQLALVAVSNAKLTDPANGEMYFDARVVGSMIYGFNFEDIDAPGAAGNGAIEGIDEVVADPILGSWGPATNLFISTMNNFFDGDSPFLSDAEDPDDIYRFTNNTNAFQFIPAPASAALLALGILAARRRRA